MGGDAYDLRNKIGLSEATLSVESKGSCSSRADVRRTSAGKSQSLDCHLVKTL